LLLLFLLFLSNNNNNIIVFFYYYYFYYGLFSFSSNQVASFLPWLRFIFFRKHHKGVTGGLGLNCYRTVKANRFFPYQKWLLTPWIHNFTTHLSALWMPHSIWILQS